MTNEPRVWTEVDNVRVKPGDSLTVWLVISEQPLKQIPVELNSRYDHAQIDAGHGIIGIPSIYTRTSEVEVKDFEEWEPGGGEL